MKTDPKHPNYFAKNAEPFGSPSRSLTGEKQRIPPSNPRTVDSHELLGDQIMVYIQHLGETYRLQTTRQGKLILTK